MSNISKAKELIAERDGIDEKLAELRLVLETNNVTMDTPLLDADGFPRSDIDVYSIRHARHDINCLENDRKALTKQIELEMEAAHSETSAHSNIEPTVKPVHRTSNEPFVKVSAVTDNSPSKLDGIRMDDHIIQYGSVHHGNFNSLADISKITAENENKVIRVTVLRDSRPVRLEIRPRKWSGPGLLGCKIVPLSGATM